MNSLISLRPSQVGKWNERQILRAIQLHGPMSRAEVVRHLGISAPTVSKAVASLLSSGLLEEIAAPSPARGRPAPILRPAVERAQVLGIVIDRVECTVDSAGFNGELHACSTVNFATPESYPDLLNRLEEICQRFLMREGVVTLGIGVSCPGLIDTRTGTGVLSPNVPMTNGKRPAVDLAERLGVETVLLNEAHALLLAEKDYGGATKLNDFALVEVGTGVGLAVMSQGRVLKGHAGMAGELGHATVQVYGGLLCGCGNYGCLETRASNLATARHVSQILKRDVTPQTAFEVIQNDPIRFEPVLQEITDYLAVGVATAVNLFNPGTVFVASQWSAVSERFLPLLNEKTKARSLAPSFADTRILAAKGTKSRGAVAAIIRQLTNAVANGLD